MKILVVDDSQAFRLIIRRYLISMSYEFMFAEDGLQAIHLFNLETSVDGRGIIVQDIGFTVLWSDYCSCIIDIHYIHVAQKIWYCKYGISYRDLVEMMLERGVEVDHTTIYRWVQHFAPEIEKRLRWYWKPTMGYSWRVDETYVKVKGKWTYLYRAIDKRGDTIDFYLSSTRNTKAAKRFLGKALKGMKSWAHPQIINTDKAPTYGPAIAQIKKEGKCPEDTVHRQVKYLNNIVEADHGKLKRLINPVRGFKSMKTAYAIIKGFEVMRMFRKGQMNAWINEQGLTGEIRLIERQFGIYTA